MADTGEAVQVMLDQAQSLGLKVDKRWSPETLAQKIIDAQDAQISEEQREFDALPKTPILLLRDAWLLTVRHNKGEIIDAPIELAKRWFKEGVAERADPLPGEVSNG